MVVTFVQNEGIVVEVDFVIIKKSPIDFHQYIYTKFNSFTNLAEILFDFCKDCNKMPSLPQGAFAACKIREQNNKEMAMAKFKKSTNERTSSSSANDAHRYFPNCKLTDLSPLKYNSKFMNAIWGHYNRYSPHNIKSVDADVNMTGASTSSNHHQ